jgi:preprotein translocase subunit SecA
MDAIKEESVGLLFNLDVQVRPVTTDEAQAPADAPAGGKAGSSPVIVAKGLIETRRPQQLQYTAPTVDGESAVEQRVERTGLGNGSRPAAAGSAASGIEFGDVARNAPCPCGSGKKFKRCHGDPRHRPE